MAAPNNVKREVLSALATFLQAQCPGLSVYPEQRDEADQSVYPSLVLVPGELVFEGCQDLERDDSDSSHLLVEVGCYDGPLEMRLYTRSAPEREQYEQLILDAFHVVELRSGTIVVQTAAALKVGPTGTATAYVPTGAMTLGDGSWREEMAFDEKRFTFLECDVAVPVFAYRTAYGLNTLVAALTTDINDVAGASDETLTVQGALSVAITPSVIALSASGQQYPMTAVATFADGTTLDVTPVATWGTTDATKATVAPSGLATGVGAGTCTLSATFQGVSGTATATVS